MMMASLIEKKTLLLATCQMNVNVIVVSLILRFLLMDT